MLSLNGKSLYFTVRYITIPINDLFLSSSLAYSALPSFLARAEQRGMFFQVALFIGENFKFQYGSKWFLNV